MSDEIWKDIAGYEGLYQVSNLGRVKSLERVVNDSVGRSRKRNFKARILALGHTKNGYLIVVLFKNGKGKTYLIHRLVARAFIPNPNNCPCVNHINNNPLYNSVENLEWCTQKENMTHAIKQGRSAKGEKHSQAKLKEEDVKWIRENYIPRDKNFDKRALARKFDVSDNTVYLIIKRKIWKHIK